MVSSTLPLPNSIMSIPNRLQNTHCVLQGASLSYHPLSELCRRHQSSFQSGAVSECNQNNRQSSRASNSPRIHPLPRRTEQFVNPDTCAKHHRSDPPTIRHSSSAALSPLPGRRASLVEPGGRIANYCMNWPPLRGRTKRTRLASAADVPCPPKNPQISCVVNRFHLPSNPPRRTPASALPRRPYGEGCVLDTSTRCLFRRESVRCK